MIVEAKYHDTLFPYSELKNKEIKTLEKSVANGLTKVYVSEEDVENAMIDTTKMSWKLQNR